MLQNYDLNLGMSPVLLKTFFAGAASPVPSGHCVLDRIQLIWREDGKPDVVTTPILRFPRHAIAKADLAHEMGFAIDSDIEQLNFQCERDEKILSRPENDDVSSRELNITNPYIVEDINAVDTLYRLTMDHGEVHDLFMMRYYLFEAMSEQVEISVRKCLSQYAVPQMNTAVLFQPRISGA